MPKVMLIEDDPTMVDLLKTLLGFEGYEVTALQGSEDIITQIRRETPDVILMDVNLKNFDGHMTSGFDLLAAMRADLAFCQIKVIISSGMNYREESRAAGAAGFIMKPYMPDDLLDLIKSNLSEK